MTDYSEDDVLDIVDQLRELGLVAVVHTESGRTERYRHYMRKRFTLTEPQIAVLTELLLRGRQSVGDLRARASRMVAIESLDDLREALRGLLAQHYLQSGGSLDRRGVEVDHNFYLPAENKKITASDRDEPEADEPEPPRPAPIVRPPVSAPLSSPAGDSPGVSARSMPRTNRAQGTRRPSRRIRSKPNCGGPKAVARRPRPRLERVSREGGEGGRMKDE